MMLTNLKKSPFDARDYKFQPIGVLAGGVDLRAPVGIYDQASIGSCTANGTMATLEMMAYRAGQPFNPSRLFTYYDSREIEGRIGQEGVVAYRDVLSSLRHQGVALEPLWPYNPAVEDEKPPDAVYADAKTRTVDSYEAVQLIPGDMMGTINNIKAALTQGLPVVLCLTVREYFRHLAGPLASHLTLDTTVPGYLNPIGGHCVVIVGYCDSPEYFIVQNSWGTDWGDGGYGALAQVAVYQDAFEAWVIRGFNGLHIAYSQEQYQIAALYAALFGRAPEKDGLAYWIGQLATLSAPAVAQAMFDCPPARTYYPAGMNNHELVTAFYGYVLGRTPDTEGLQYWAGELASLKLASPYPVGQLIVNMVAAVYAYDGTDQTVNNCRQLLLNKIDVGLYYGVTLAANDIPKAQSAFAGVTFDPASVTAAKARLAT